MKQHYLLGEGAKILNRRPHQISYLLTTGRVPEPEQRIANKRLFTDADVVNLSRQLKATPDWSAVERMSVNNQSSATGCLALKPPFEVLRAGESGHEVRDGDGIV